MRCFKRKITIFERFYDQKGCYKNGSKKNEGYSRKRILMKKFLSGFVASEFGKLYSTDFELGNFGNRIKCCIGQTVCSSRSKMER